jgi:signal transduction histidine kinase
LTNAFRHSLASQITVQLDYQRRLFRFICRDNGRGFDPEVSQTDGHWGLRGMAERAARIGATFAGASSPGEGAEIQVTVPAHRAYRVANKLGTFVVKKR